MSILRCVEPFAVQDGNLPRVMRSGDVVESDDPIVKGHESMFEPVESFIVRRAAGTSTGTMLETATADPGEKRAVTKPPPRKRAAKKAAPK